MRVEYDHYLDIYAQRQLLGEVLFGIFRGNSGGILKGITKLVVVSLLTIVPGYALAAQPAPTLSAVVAVGNEFRLTWSIPVMPDAGFDIVVDGVDAQATYRTTGLSAAIPGLNTGRHCFMVEARFLAPNPDEFPRSTEVCADSTPKAPVWDSITMADFVYTPMWKMPGLMPDGGFEVIVDGARGVPPYRTNYLEMDIRPYSSVPLPEHCFVVEARYVQAGLYLQSTPMCAESHLTPSPVLNSVEARDGKFYLRWALPDLFVADGGFDIIVDGLDSQAAYRTQETSTVISGLSPGKHCFVIEARYLADGVYPRSGQLCADSSLKPVAPVISSVGAVNGEFSVKWELAGLPPDGGFDLLVDGVDTGSSHRTSETSAVISGLPIGPHCFIVEARYVASNVYPRSTQVCGDSTPKVTPPVLNTVRVSGGVFSLSWSTAGMMPDGGFDIVVDGADTGTTHRTNLLTASISGLPSGTHCFVIESRYLAAGEYLRSNQVCATSSSVIVPPPPPPSGPMAVFPGAVGFGTKTAAGRGGTILRVKNLNDSGPDSLRAAVGASGPRIIVFETSGRIDLKSDLTISNPFITIAGQSAPAPGIMITGRTFKVETHDVLVQHLSIRVGDENKPDDSGRTADTIQVSGTETYNVVFDHVSASWSIDEIVGIGYGIKDISFLNCLIAEPLNKSIHPKNAHGYAFLLGDNSTRVSLIGNMIGHAIERLPRIQGGSFLLVNNVMYNKGGEDFSSIGANNGTPTYLAALGNLYLEGPNGTVGRALAESSASSSSSQIFQKDNWYPVGRFSRDRIPSRPSHPKPC